MVTGPFKVNGVPLRRVNARYVIATSHKVDLSGIDQKKVDEVAGDKYFAREKSEKKKGEEEFFKQGEKPEVCSWAKLDLESFINSRLLEEEAVKQPRRRSKSRGQGSFGNYQEGAHATQLPQQHFQLAQGRSTTRNGMVNGT